MTQKKTIAVPTKTCLRDVDVLGTYGVWAAHLTIYDGNTPLRDVTITHVPSRLLFLRDLPSLESARLVMRLLPKRWAADLKPVEPGQKMSRSLARRPGWRACAAVKRAIEQLIEDGDIS